MLFGRILWSLKYNAALEIISKEIVEEAKNCQTCQVLYKNSLGGCVGCSNNRNIKIRHLKESIPYMFYSSGMALILFSFIWPFTLTVISIFELADSTYPVVRQYIENKKTQFIEQSIQIQTKKLRSETKLREAELEAVRLSNREKATQQLREIQLQSHKK
jgi:hypothetical protein